MEIDKGFQIAFGLAMHSSGVVILTHVFVSSGGLIGGVYAVILMGAGCFLIGDAIDRIIETFKEAEK